MGKVKVFISQPMKERTNEQIEAERNEIKKKLEEKYGDNFEVIDSAPHDAKPLWFLGKSFVLLSTADVCVFAKGWNNARGCCMEHRACEEYHITIWEM